MKKQNTKISDKEKVLGLNPYLILFFIILITGIIYITTFRSGHNWGGDFAQYIAQAKSIVEGNISKLVSVVNYRNENSSHIGPGIYPWGFPLLLAPIYSIFGINMFAMKVFVSLFFLWSLPIIFFLFKNKIGLKNSLLIVSIFAVSPWFFTFKDNILSDIPFFCFALISILLIQKIVINKKTLINIFTDYILIGFFISFSYHIRSQGIILIPTLFFAQYISDKKIIESKKIFNYLLSNIFKLLPYAIFIITFVTINILLPMDDNYIKQLLSKISIVSVIKNVKYYSDIMSIFFGQSNITKIIFGASLPFTIIGVVKSFKKDYLYLLYILFTLVLLIIWPWRQGFRFIASISPFYIYFTFTGLIKTPDSLFLPDRYKYTNIKLVKIFGFLVIIILPWLLFSFSITKPYIDFYPSQNTILKGPYSEESLKLFDYLSQNTPKDSIINFRKPRVMTLYTNRISIIVTGVDDIVNSNANYIVTSPEELSPLMDKDLYKKYKNIFKLVYKNDDFKVYRIIKNA